MPRKKKSAVAPKTVRKRRMRGRVSKVRETILKLLAEQPSSRAELLKRGKFSPASLHNHIKALRAEGAVVVDASNRILSLKEGGAATKPAGKGASTASLPAKTAPAQALVPLHGSRSLHEALDAVSERFKPIVDLDEKLLVLSELGKTMPVAVAGVLAEVASDLMRVSGGLSRKD